MAQRPSANEEPAKHKKHDNRFVPKTRKEIKCAK
jgi:hypothetical protein